MTELDPKKEKLAERPVSGFLFLSIVESILAVVAYFVFPIEPGARCIVVDEDRRLAGTSLQPQKARQALVSTRLLQGVDLIRLS